MILIAMMKCVWPLSKRYRVLALPGWTVGPG